MRTPSHAALALGASLTCALAADARGFVDLIVVLSEFDAVPGVGLVTSIDNLAVNNAGEWIVEADTDNANTDIDSVLVRNGTLFLREGDPVDIFPAGPVIGTFDSVTLNDAGSSAFNFFLDGTTGGSDDSAIFKDAFLVIQEGNTAGASGFAPGTVFTGFFDVKHSNNNTFLSVLSVDDPTIASTTDRAVVIFQDPSMGFTQHVVAIEGELLPGQSQVVNDFGTSPHLSAINDRNDVLVSVDLEGDTTTDGAIYLFVIDDFFPDAVTDRILIAQEGFPSPVAGRNWASLSSPELDLNNLNEYVHSGTLDGDTATDLLIVRNGAKFKQEGDAVTTLSGTWSLTSFGSGPVLISAAGDVLWYGDWDDPDTDRDTGLFVNDTLLVHEGVTTVGGVSIDTLRGITDGYAFSNSGRYVILEAVLANGNDVALLLDLGRCPADCAAAHANGAFGNGLVNIDDLLAVINAFGPCPGKPDPCPCDNAPDNGDGTFGNGVVNVDDLLGIINNFGPCSALP